jgi:hypothetical protein
MEDYNPFKEGHVAGPNDESTKPTSTTSRSTTRKTNVEDILERMVILSKPAEAKKAAL